MEIMSIRGGGGGVQRLMEDSILNINFVFRITPLIGKPSTTT